MIIRNPKKTFGTLRATLRSKEALCDPKGPRYILQKGKRGQDNTTTQNQDVESLSKKKISELEFFIVCQYILIKNFQRTYLDITQYLSCNFVAISSWRDHAKMSKNFDKSNNFFL